MKMNLPNRLTVMRLIMVPIFMVVMLIPAFHSFGNTVDTILSMCGLVLFIAASLTDMLDGKIARKHNLVTDFGKFLDPLADKFMVIGALLCIFYNSFVNHEKHMSLIYFTALVIVIFRELAVTSIRLVASSSGGVVIAANKLGKLKTVTQIFAVCAAIGEPVIYRAAHVDGFLREWPIATVVLMAAMSILTVISGINYIVGAWKYLDPQK